MLKFITSGLLALGLATGASAQGVTFSGGAVSVNGTGFLSGGLSSAPIISVDGSLAYDFTGSDFEFQLGADLPAANFTTDYYEATFLVAKQSGNSKFGAYAGVLGMSGAAVLDAGIAGITEAASGGYFEGTLGAAGTSSRIISYGLARYTQGNWFGQAKAVAWGPGTVFYGASAGYETTIGNFATVSVSLGIFGASSPSGVVGTAKVGVEIPFGGANSGNGVDDRLFRNIGFTGMDLVF